MERNFITSVDDVDEETKIGSLAFSGATEDDEGTYICSITNELGTAESTFTLIVNEPGNCVHLEYMV